MRPVRAIALALGLLTVACNPRTAPGDVPVHEDELVPWLEARSYADWSSESVEHLSKGAHMGWVRLWVDDTLAESLEVDDAEHPPGSTAVLELYGPGGEEVVVPSLESGQLLGWAVSVKLDEPSGAEGWYQFHQFFQNRQLDGESVRVRADREGVALPECLECHGDVADHIVTEWPLR